MKRKKEFSQRRESHGGHDFHTNCIDIKDLLEEYMKATSQDQIDLIAERLAYLGQHCSDAIEILFCYEICPIKSVKRP